MTAGQPYAQALQEYNFKTLGINATDAAGAGVGGAAPRVVRKADSVEFASDAFDVWDDDLTGTGNDESAPGVGEGSQQQEAGKSGSETESVQGNESAAGNNGTASAWDDGWEDEGPSLPSPFLPDFWAAFCLFVLLVLNALLPLVQHWSINAKTFIQYREISDFRDGAYVKVIPSDPHSPAEIVKVEESHHYRCPDSGKTVLWFTSHKRKYEIVRGEICKIQMPKNLTVREYTSSQGYTRMKDVESAEERFGPNKFEIPMPTFKDLYVKQLLSPMSVFQVFCVGLWLLDSAWKYALFGLFSVFGFEATSVVTRLKNIQMIRGMSNTPQEIFTYRFGKWIKISTENLLPGDLISVKRLPTSSGDVVPCDCVILSGSAVINEATLTGESVPQMKEALSGDASTLGRKLNIKGGDKISVLYGGTTILQLTPGTTTSSSSGEGKRDATPDDGCLCYVLRTGFSSSQGKLVRMIELSSSGSTSSNKDFLRESLLMICLLLVFAVFASSYVLRKGFEAGNRTRYELLIHCILIVTSVVPPDLPMQLAIAVNASIIHLVRKNVFCTEPFRVPLAGKIDSCFFDKTGTITTDKLEATGVVPAGGVSDQSSPLDMADAPLECCRVIGGCHSLLQVEGKILGDPIEAAALKAIGWDYDQGSQRSFPSAESERWGGESVRIVQRYHFSSKLQRMSTIAEVRCSSSSQKNRYAVFTKGSPEMIATLLGGPKPRGYDMTYQRLARKGMRVIALAYRNVSHLPGEDKPVEDSDTESCHEQLKKATRQWAESDLVFAGFVAFRCLMRKDSKEIIGQLQKSNHHVAMITGDNVLTALHVACEVGLTNANREKVAILEKMEHEPYLQWINASTEAAIRDFDVAGVGKMKGEGYDLCVSGKALQRCFELYSGDEVGLVLDSFNIFARMTPEGKEKVLSLLNARKKTTLMCGDGANDVGALRQAHVGVALLSGFGSLNADKTSEDGGADPSSTENNGEDPGSSVAKKDNEGAGEKLGFFDRLKKQLEDTKREAESSQADRKKRMEEMKAKRAKYQKEAQERKQRMMREVEEETRRLTAQGESFASFKAMKTVMQKFQAENKKKVADAGGSFAMSAAAMAAKNDDLEDGEMPILKLGDASTAAPFTSKFPSIRSVYDIIRQGRCTLVTSVQNNLMMVLNSLISSYSLSVLYLDGVKFSDYQMTATGFLLTASHLAVSHVAPLQEVSPVRPVTSMFHPALFFSLFGQFAIHLASMIVAVRGAKQYMDPGFKQDMDGKFSPNLINTVVFFIETVQQVSVLIVNYKGRPFQPGLDENKALLHSLGISFIGLFICAYEVFPVLNNLLELQPFPNDQFRWTIICLLVFDVGGALLWDRLMHFIFAKKLFMAGQSDMDSVKFIRGCFKVVASAVSVYILFNGGGLFGIGVVWFLYRNGFY